MRLLPGLILSFSCSGSAFDGIVPDLRLAFLARPGLFLRRPSVRFAHESAMSWTEDIGGSGNLFISGLLLSGSPDYDFSLWIFGAFKAAYCYLSFPSL